MYQITTTLAKISTRESSPNGDERERPGDDTQADGDEHLEEIPTDRGDFEATTARE